MAGWKLRKDKASAETPGTDSDPALAVETPSTPESPFLDTVPGLPDFDSEADIHFDAGSHSDGLEYGHAAGAAGHADGGSLTLVDYTEPIGDAAAQEPHAHIYDAPTYDAPNYNAVIAMPPPEAAAETEFEPDAEFGPETEFGSDAEFEPLAASSSWLSSDFSAETPPVAPFVLDTPAPAVLTAAPQIVVHIGRLSAPFALTKDVTTIGRPDSALSHYPDVEIEMDDAVSRRHCEIVKREVGYYLVDTGSTNGTRLNGETLLPHQEHLLAHGDRIHLGDRTEITFE